VRRCGGDGAKAAYELWLDDGAWSSWARESAYAVGALAHYLWKNDALFFDVRYAALRGKHTSATIAALPSELRDAIAGLANQWKSSQEKKAEKLYGKNRGV